MRLLPILAIAAGLLPPLPALAREPLQPAELPPPDFRGQQYVDSRGCAFVRAGSGGEVVWVPRVSREGQPLCIDAKSGKSMPVARKDAGTAVPDEPRKPKPLPALTDRATGGFFVAVGSYDKAENAHKAEARLKALHYEVAKGSVPRGSGSLVTVFAGPFADADMATLALQALREAGFPDATVIGP